MIVEIREYLQSKIVRIAMLGMSIGLLGLFTLPTLISKASRAWVMKINQDTIDSNYYEMKVAEQEERMSYLRSQYGQYLDMILQASGMSNDPKKMASELIIQESLIKQLAGSMGIAPSKRIAQEKIGDQGYAQKYLESVVPGFLYDQGGINQEIVKIFLQRRKWSADAFLQEVAGGMAQQAAMSLIKMTGYVPNYEKELWKKSRHATKEIAIIFLDEHEFVKRAMETPVNEKTLQEFYENKNKTAQTYYEPEKRDIQVWTFSAQNYSIEFAKNELESFYNEHKNSKYIEKQATAQVKIITYPAQLPENSPSIATIQEELVKNPEKFSEYAKKYSHDKASSVKGGLIEPLKYQEKNNSLYRAAFGLENPLAISPVFEHEGGFAIVQLIEKKQKTYKSFDSVKKDIESTLTKKMFKDRFGRDMKLALKDGVIDDKEISALSTRHNAKKETKENVTFKTEAPYTKTAFGLQKEGQAGFFVIGEMAYLVKLLSIKPKFLQQFATVKKEVEKDWYVLQGAQLLQQYYNQIKEIIKTKTLAEIAQEKKLTLETISISPLAEKEKTMRDLLEKKGIELEEFMEIEHVGALISGMHNASAYFAQCTSLSVDPNTTLSKDETESLEREKKQVIFAGVIASLHRDATIKTNESFNIPLEDYFV